MNTFSLLATKRPLKMGGKVVIVGGRRATVSLSTSSGSSKKAATVAATKTSTDSIPPPPLAQHYQSVLWTRAEGKIIPHPSSRPRVYEKLRARLAAVAGCPSLPPTLSRTPLLPDQEANLTRSVKAMAQGQYPMVVSYPAAERGRQALLARLKADNPEGGESGGLFEYSHLMLHVEYTRFLRLCDELRGLSCDDALLQLTWHDKTPMGKRMHEALLMAMVRAREEGGLDLSKTYVADVFVKGGETTESVLSSSFARRYIRGRSRYGAVPQFKSSILDFILQQRDRPFAKRLQDPLEWLRVRLRKSRAACTKVTSADALVSTFRAERRPVKVVHV